MPMINDTFANVQGLFKDELETLGYRFSADPNCGTMQIANLRSLPTAPLTTLLQRLEINTDYKQVRVLLSQGSPQTNLVKSTDYTYNYQTGEGREKELQIWPPSKQAPKISSKGPEDFTHFVESEVQQRKEQLEERREQELERERKQRDEQAKAREAEREQKRAIAFQARLDSLRLAQSKALMELRYDDAKYIGDAIEELERQRQEDERMRREWQEHQQKIERRYGSGVG